MHALRIAVAVIWALFWSGWLASAFGAKASKRRNYARAIPAGLGLRVVLAVIVGVLVRGPLHNFRGAANHDLALGAVGVAMILAGLGFAVWARVRLGANWGMPMTERAEPELITAGPYRYVRHPIYTGLLLALAGTAVAVNLLFLIIALAAGIYFMYAALVEERNMAAAFPEAYPQYRARSKMLIPFLL